MTSTHDVVERHRGWLVRFIVSRTRSQAGVEDVLQDVGLAVVRSTRQPEREQDVKPWLCTIAIRQCALALRKAQRHRRLLEGAATNTADPLSNLTLDDPLFWLLNRERSDLVRQSLAAMDDEQRSLLIRKYVDGMTYGQLAKCLGVAAHVVEYRVVAARKSLRRLVIARGLGEDDLP